LLRARIVKDVPDEGLKMREVRTYDERDFAPNHVFHAYVSKHIREFVKKAVSAEYLDNLKPFDNEVDRVSCNRHTVELVEEYRADHECYGAYLFLVALAVENILKSICVLRHHDDLVRNKKRLDARLGRHNLYSLATDADKLCLQLSRRENRILKILEELIVAGRYPVQSTSAAYRTYRGGEACLFRSKNRFKFSENEESIHELYERLLNVLNTDLRRTLPDPLVKF
jgi:hypothetical protein